MFIEIQATTTDQIINSACRIDMRRFGSLIINDKHDAEVEVTGVRFKI